ncbi:Crp/Fnr family transcriptional regulator [Nocardia sp. XZ_19_369]|uniref:Crp/Fnr family transcriptional regulator n=1 Tax=Nocardia sp. XZ_19_369 TaxID=2769487 RepID=UPI0018902B0C|nr:Crp/Fnr family transcriptional regulator [Nocardia sp. XZ_19_369]
MPTTSYRSQLSDLSLGLTLADQISTGRVRGPVRRVPAGSRIYGRGDTSDWICLIRIGWAKTLSTSPQGKLCVLGIEGPGSVLGVAKDAKGSRSEDIVTKTEVQFNVVPRADFERFLATPLFGAQWRRHMIELMSERQRTIISFVTLDSERRLAATLVQLGTNWGITHDASTRLRCSLTHEELGQMVGTTRSRIGYFINRFHELGMVSKSADGLVLHMEVLRRFVQG